MSAVGASQGPATIGEVAAAPYAVLPDPATLFLTRSKRLRALAPGHTLEPYLSFVADVAEAQHAAQADLPPAKLPAAEAIRRALEQDTPPLARDTFEPGEAGLITMRRFLEGLRQAVVPAEAAAAIQSLRAASSDELSQLIGAALKDAPAENIAMRVLALAGLQIHLSRLAANLTAADLKRVAGGACPACGSPPMTGSVVGWPNAHNSRYCACALCGTMWNVVRIKCVFCSSTEGIGYHAIEGQPDTVKAETCDKCGRYLKVLYQVKDHMLDPLADDVATLGLDLLIAKEGWKHGGQNPFLLGY
jgi:FdhE protein